MAKCPNNRKTSDLASSNGQQSLSKPLHWGSLAGLAKLQGCSERTIREWCKQGLIPEAYRTSGGHWRIQMPLSPQTCSWLEKRSKHWPFRDAKKDGDLSDFEPEFAEWQALAQLFKRPVN